MSWPTITADKQVNLNAVLTLTDGVAIPCAGCRTFSLQVVLAGTVTTAIVLLQGSIDGVSWFTLATWDKATPQTSGDLVYAVDKPVQYVRASLTTFTTQAAGRTVTAIISAI